MILNWLFTNFWSVISVLVLIGGWLIFLGKFQQKFDDHKRDVDRTNRGNEIAMEKINNKLDQQDEKFARHLAEKEPHKSCLVEITKGVDNAQRLDELHESIKRVEGWVMALVAKAGIKEPKNGY